MTSVLLNMVETDSIFTLQEAKSFMRIEFDMEDTLIEAQLKTAVQACEDYTRRSFLKQKRSVAFVVPSSINLSNRNFEPFNDGSELHYGPVDSVTLVQSLKRGQVQETLTTGTHYWLEGNKLHFDFETLNPKFIDAATSIVRVEYITGLSKTDLADKFPALIEAVKIVLHNAWDGRGFNSTAVPPAARAMLLPYRNQTTFLE